MSSAIDATRNSYAAALVACVAYGIYVVLAFQCLIRLCTKYSKSPGVGERVILVYAVLLCIGQTIYFIGGCKWSSIEFVDSQVDPAVFAGELSSRLSILKDTMYTINIWIADSFLLYRASIIWGIDIFFGIPLLFFFGALATGIGLLVETGKPGAVFGQVSVINFGTPFWSLSVATNVSATILIAGRLLWRRRALGRVSGAIAHDLRSSTSAAAIFIESAAMYAVSGIIYIPLFAVDTPVQYPFSALLGGVVSIAPTLIMLRMVDGTAITKEWSEIPLNNLSTTAAPEQSRPSAHSSDTVQVSSYPNIEDG